MNVTLNSPYEDLKKYFSSVLDHPIQEFPEREPTILDIARFPHYENVISNFYEFFLADKKYGLGSVFLHALLDCIGDEKIFMREWIVIREEVVDAGRIDLVVKEASNEPQAVIIIENKIHHHLESNNLAGYLSAYKEIANRVGVVLTVRPLNEGPGEGYVNITHQQWMEAVKHRAGTNMTAIHARYLMILQDFAQHIDSFYETNVTMDSFTFLFENGEKIDALNRLRFQAFEQIEKRIIGRFPQPWNSWKIAQGKYIVRRHAFFYLYVVTDKIFRERPSYKIEVWMKGRDQVANWKSRMPNAPNGIIIQKDRNTTEWAHIGVKEYSFKRESIETLEVEVGRYILSEWNEYIDEVTRIVAITTVTPER